MNFWAELAQNGTNAWILGFVQHNWLLLVVVLAPVFAWIKCGGNRALFWSSLQTVLPMFGHPDTLVKNLAGLITTAPISNTPPIAPEPVANPGINTPVAKTINSNTASTGGTTP